MKAHATPISFGGIILAGLFLVIGIVAWFGGGVFLLLPLLVLGYCIESTSESLELRDGFVSFNSFLRRKKRVNVCAMDEVLVVHEGLNQEHGIVSIVFRAKNRPDMRVALGPMWRRRDLETFFAGIEAATGACKLVE